MWFRAVNTDIRGAVATVRCQCLPSPYLIGFAGKNSGHVKGINAIFRALLYDLPLQMIIEDSNKMAAIKHSSVFGLSIDFFSICG